MEALGLSGLEEPVSAHTNEREVVIRLMLDQNVDAVSQVRWNRSSEARCWAERDNHELFESHSPKTFQRFTIWHKTNPD